MDDDEDEDGDECVAHVTIDQVRHLALAAGGLEEVSFQARARKVSFQRKVDGSRITVLFTAGTGASHRGAGGGTAGERHVTLVELLQLFVDPRLSSGRDAYTPAQREMLMLVEEIREEVQAEEAAAAASSWSRKSRAAAAAEEARKAELAAAFQEKTAAAKSAERERAAEAERERQCAAEREAAAAKERKRRAVVERERRAEAARLEAIEAAEANKAEVERRRGLCWFGKFLSDDGNDYQSALAQLVSRTVCSVAIWEGYILAFDDARCAHWGIPQGLHHKLNGRQRSLPQPISFALGCEGRWYVQFSDGKYYEDGGEADFTATLVELAMEHPGVTMRVSYGIGGSYAISYGEEGGYRLHIVPDGVVNIIEHLEPGEEVGVISLGPRGEYFVAAGTRRWLNTEDMLDGELTALWAEHGADFATVLFGAHGSYVVRWDNGRE
jgi:hypothetical protein